MKFATKRTSVRSLQFSGTLAIAWVLLVARSHTQIEVPPVVDRSVHDYVGLIDSGIVDRME